MDAISGVGAARAVPASDNLRLEPTALPTCVFRLGAVALGWHPVLTPARVAA